MEDLFTVPAGLPVLNFWVLCALFHVKCQFKTIWKWLFINPLGRRILPNPKTTKPLKVGNCGTLRKKTKLLTLQKRKKNN